MNKKEAHKSNIKKVQYLKINTVFFYEGKDDSSRNNDFVKILRYRRLRRNKYSYVQYTYVLFFSLIALIILN